MRVFDVTATKLAFIGGEVMAGMSWNGDAFISITESPNLAYVYPKEGVPMWSDNFAIPVGAENIDHAHTFINFMLRPDIAAICVEEYNYTSPNMAVVPLLPEAQQTAVKTVPHEEDLKNSELCSDVGSALEIYSRYWEMLKTAD